MKTWATCLFATAIAACALGGSATEDAAPGHVDSTIAHHDDAHNVVGGDATPGPHDASVSHDAFVPQDAPNQGGGFCSDNTNCGGGTCCWVAICVPGTPVGTTLCFPN